MPKQKFPKLGDPNFFPCRCSKKSRRQVKRMRKKAFALLGIGTENRYGYTPTEEDLFGNIVFSLLLDYNAAITGIHADQWFGVGTETYDKKEGTDLPTFSTFNMCDDPMDGIIAAYMAYQKKFGHERKRDKEGSWV